MIERFRESARDLVQGAPGQVDFPGVEVGVGDDVIERPQVIAREHDDFVDVLYAELRDPSVPVEVGLQLGQFIQCVFPVVARGVAHPFLGQVFSRQPRLQRHDRLGRPGAAVDAGEIEHFRDVINVGLANLRRAFVFLEIILSVRQAQAAVRNQNGVVLRVEEIGKLLGCKRRIQAPLQRPGKIDRELIVIFDRVDSIELRPERFDAAGVARFPVKK